MSRSEGWAALDGLGTLSRPGRAVGSPQPSLRQQEVSKAGSPWEEACSLRLSLASTSQPTGFSPGFLTAEKCSGSKEMCMKPQKGNGANGFLSLRPGSGLQRAAGTPDT